jgi:hypothetical protein
MNVEVTVKIGVLVGFLKAARQRHVDEYEASVHTYFKQLQERLALLQPQAGARKFRDDNYSISMQPPVDCTDRYDKYIGMLEMAEEDYMKITAEQYDCFVGDKWRWAEDARLMNSMYK